MRDGATSPTIPWFAGGLPANMALSLDAASMEAKSMAEFDQADRAENRISGA